MSEKRKLGLVFASGASNRICCIVIYGGAALAAGWEVRLHLVNEGLVAFRKDLLPKLNSLDIDTTIRPGIYLPYAELYLKNVKAAVENGQLKDWYSFLKQLKTDYPNEFKIYACPVAAAMYNIKKEDLVDIVDEIKGAESFLEEIYGGVTMYI
ncbi:MULTISPECIES: DsrE/DsrF/DrsH-like family protein [Metallosphaera]|uniref:DsrE/DsrF/DrsH-like family protein n=1 Tax=Metallosphaera TaxID=41980 RepID=UPI001F06E1B8|nr:DsrE/DsrF/DrsH-like family protein [Metallosphaera sedula]MCH1770305.1 DsrE/DsrF/DrsH-like family protein [Metallosphaera sedula]MCP6727861.1 DsrE/DsrF/DrsH-like family protein [Metallosphaera sedula]